MSDKDLGCWAPVSDFDRGFELGQEEGFGTGIFVGVVLGLAMWAGTYFALGVWP